MWPRSVTVENCAWRSPDACCGNRFNVATVRDRGEREPRPEGQRGPGRASMWPRSVTVENGSKASNSSARTAGFNVATVRDRGEPACGGGGNPPQGLGFNVATVRDRGERDAY